MPLLAGLGPLGVPELLIIAFIILLVFGVGRLPEVGGALGKGIREFRKSSSDDDKPSTDASAPAASSAEVSAPSSDTSASDVGAFCTQCGTKNLTSAKFCASCGHQMPAVVG
jgi:sec-independent protein translocase protein TatA